MLSPKPPSYRRQNCKLRNFTKLFIYAKSSLISFGFCNFRSSLGTVRLAWKKATYVAKVNVLVSGSAQKKKTVCRKVIESIASWSRRLTWITAAVSDSTDEEEKDSSESDAETKASARRPIKLKWIHRSNHRPRVQLQLHHQHECQNGCKLAPKNAPLAQR